MRHRSVELIVPFVGESWRTIQGTLFKTNQREREREREFGIDGIVLYCIALHCIALYLFKVGNSTDTVYSKRSHYIKK